MCVALSKINSTRALSPENFAVGIRCRSCWSLRTIRWGWRVCSACTNQADWHCKRKGNETKKKQCLKLLGLEQFSPGHHFGASHGESRIYHHAYFEHSDYVPLLLYSTAVFQDIQRNYTTNRLIHSCGTLLVDREDDDDFSIVRKSIESASIYNIPVVPMSATELQHAYPFFHVSDSSFRGVLEPTGGFVCPELAIQLALKDAVSSDAIVDIRYHTTVLSIEPHSEHSVALTVQTGNTVQCYSANRVIVAAGAWTSTLLPSFTPHLRITRQIQAWFEPLDQSIIDWFYTCPTWYLCRGKELPGLYGIPCRPYLQQPWYKVALHGREDPIHDDPVENAKRAPSTNELEELHEALAEWMQFVHSLPCTYTSTIDNHFVLETNVPGFPKHTICCIAGLSGHGFKMAPALGKAAADLVWTGTTDLPVEFLRGNRFHDTTSL